MSNILDSITNWFEENQKRYEKTVKERNNSQSTKPTSTKSASTQKSNTGVMDSVENFLTKYFTTQGVETLDDSSKYKQISQNIDKQFSNDGTIGTSVFTPDSKAKEMGEKAKNRTTTTTLLSGGESNGYKLTDTDLDQIGGVLIDKNTGKKADTDYVNNLYDTINKTSENINSEIEKLNSLYEQNYISADDYKTKYNEYLKSFNENQEKTKELDNYNYLSGKEYYDWLKENGTKDEVESFEAYVGSYDDTRLESLANSYKASLVDLAKTPIDTISMLKTYGERNLDNGYDYTADNTLSSKLTNVSNELKSYTNNGKNGEGVRSYSLQTIASVMPMVNDIVLAMITGGAMGLEGAGLQTFASAFTNTQFGLASASDTMRERIAQGNKVDTSFYNAVAHGLITAGIEAMDVGNVMNFTSLFTGAGNDILGVGLLSLPRLYTMAANSIQNGLGEGFEEWAEATVDYLFDNMFNAISNDKVKIGTNPFDISSYGGIGEGGLTDQMIMAFGSAIIMDTPTNINNAKITIDSKKKYNAATEAKKYWASAQAYHMANNDIESANKCQAVISLIDTEMRTYEETSPVSSAVYTENDAVPNAPSIDEVMNMNANAFRLDVCDAVETADQAKAKATQVYKDIQSELVNRGMYGINNNGIDTSGIDVDTYVSLTPEGRKAVKSLLNASNVIGADVKISDKYNKGNLLLTKEEQMQYNENGVTLKGGSIIINPYSKAMMSNKGTDVLNSTLAHELTHTVEKTGNYKNLRQAIIDSVGKSQFDADIKKYTELYKSKNLSTESIEKEVVAKYIEHNLKNMGDMKFFQTIYDYNESAFTRLYTSLKAALNSDPNIKVAKEFFKAYDQRITDAMSKPYYSNVFGDLISSNNCQFNIAQFDEKGRDVLVNYLDKQVKNKKLTREEANDIINQLDYYKEMIDNMTHNSDFAFDNFLEWSDVSMTKDHEGYPQLTCKVKNGDYTMNIDFSTVCKKRLDMDALFNSLAKEGILDSKALTSEQIGKLREIIKSNGLEVACALCFVDSKRYNQGGWADTLINGKEATEIKQELIDLGVIDKENKHIMGWNEFVDRITPEGVEAADFNFAQREDVKDGTLHTLDSKSLSEGMKWLKKVINVTDAKSEIGSIARALYNHPELRKHMLLGDLYASTSFSNIKKGMSGNKAADEAFFKIVNKHQGVAKPKSPYLAVTYNNEIIKSRGFTSKAAASVGGVRVQSFSDYMANMVFDYMEMVSELSAKKLTSHSYTKVADYAKLFGLTGIKINLSIIPKATVMSAKEVALLSDEQKAEIKKTAGLEIFTKEEVKAMESPDYEGWKKLSKEEKKDYRNYKEYLETERGLSLTTDRENYSAYIFEDESFNWLEALEIQAMEGYDKNVGTICVGVSDEHIWKMLNDGNVKMVIPYHKSSLNNAVAHMMNIGTYNDYTDYQTTGVWNGKEWISIGSGDNKNKYKDFSFYDGMGKNYIGMIASGYDAKQVSLNYLKWCADNGFRPKFDRFAYIEKEGGDWVRNDNGSYSFVGEGKGNLIFNENYFKLLIDFRCYDANGNIAPQSEVKMNFPDNFKELVFDSLKRYESTTNTRNEKLSDIVNETKDYLASEQFSLSEDKIITAEMVRPYANELGGDIVEVGGEYYLTNTGKTKSLIIGNNPILNENINFNEKLVKVDVDGTGKYQSVYPLGNAEELSSVAKNMNVPANAFGDYDSTFEKWVRDNIKEEYIDRYIGNHYEYRKEYINRIVNDETISETDKKELISNFVPNGRKNLVMSDDRIKSVYSQYEGKGYIVNMRPENFLKLTTGKYGQYLNEIKDGSRPLNMVDIRLEDVGFILEVDNIEVTHRNGMKEYGIEPSDNLKGKVTGHEGRHRMVALQNANVDYVPVVVKTRYIVDTPYEIKDFFLDGQEFSEEDRYNLTRSIGNNPIAITKENVDKIKATYGTLAKPDYYGVSNVQFSLSDETDSDGTNLTNGQVGFFEDSKVRDGGGKLMPMYHGTAQAGFTEFLHGIVKENATSGFNMSPYDIYGFWFTSSMRDAGSYGGNYENIIFNPSENLSTTNTNVVKDATIGGLKFIDEKSLKQFKDRYLKNIDYIDPFEYKKVYDNAEEMYANGEITRGQYDSIIDNLDGIDYDSIIGKYVTYIARNEINNDREPVSLEEMVENRDKYDLYDFLVAQEQVYDGMTISEMLGQDINDFENEEDAKSSIIDNWIEANNYDIESGNDDDSHLTNMVYVRSKVGEQVNNVKYDRKRTYKTYLNIVNPYIIDNNGSSIFPYEEVERASNDSKYDGVIVKNTRGIGYFNDLSTIALAKDSNQVKLTTNLNPTDNNDIQYALSEEDIASYNEAYKNNDVEKAQKVLDKVAVNNGYKKGYHGTMSEWNIYDINKNTGDNELGDYIYLTNSKEVANNYANPNTPDNLDKIVRIAYESDDYDKTFNEMLSKEGNVKELYWKMANPLVITDSDISNLGYINYQDKLAGGNYDGIIDKTFGKRYGLGNDVVQYVLFNPEQIKSAEPFTYDGNGNLVPLEERFNENSNDIRFSIDETEDKWVKNTQEVVDKVTDKTGEELTVEDIDDLLHQRQINPRTLKAIQDTKDIMTEEAEKWVKGYDLLRAKYPMVTKPTFNSAMYEILCLGELGQETKDKMVNALYNKYDAFLDWSDDKGSINKSIKADQWVAMELDQFVNDALKLYEYEVAYQNGKIDIKTIKKSIRTNQAYNSTDFAGEIEKQKLGTMLDKMSSELKQDLKAKYEPLISETKKANDVAKETSRRGKLDADISQWATIDQNIDRMCHGNVKLRNMWHKMIRTDLLDVAAKVKQDVLRNAQTDVIDKVKNLGIVQGSKESKAVQYLLEGHTEIKEKGAYTKFTEKDLLSSYDYKMKNGKMAYENIKEASKIIRDAYDSVYFEITRTQLDANGDVEGKAKAEIEEKKIEVEQNAKVLENILTEVKRDGVKESLIGVYETEKKKLNKSIKEYNNLIERNSTKDLTRRNLTPYRENFSHHVFDASLKNVINGIVNAEYKIPTEVAGITDITKPNTRFTTISLEQTGAPYIADAVRSYAEYMTEAANVISYNPVILNIRQICSDITALVDGDDLNKLKTYLTDYANMLSGKRSEIDRWAQKAIGDAGMKTIQALNSYAKGAALAFNVRSGLVQFANIPNGMGILEANGGASYVKDVANGMKNYITNIGKKSVLQESAFLGNRFFDFDTGDKTLPKKLNDMATAIIQIGDKVGAELIWWSAYEQGNRLKVENSVLYADSITRRAIAGRTAEDMSLGMRSQVINLLLPFQVENINLFETIRNESANKRAGAILNYSVMAFVFNMAIKWITGGDDEVLPEFITPIYEEIKKALEGETEAKDVVKNIFWGEIAEFISLLPFGSQATDLVLGDDSESIFGEYNPNRYGLTNIGLSGLGNMLSDMKKHEDDPTQQILDVIDNLIAGYVKGGKQAMRTIEGLQSMGGLPDYKNGEVQISPINYTNSGKISWVSDQNNIGDWIRATLFGKWNTTGAREYIGSNFKTLSNTATNVFETLQETGMNISESFKEAKSLSDTDLRTQLKEKGNYDEYRQTVEDAYKKYLETTTDADIKTKAEFYNSYGLSKNDLLLDQYDDFYKNNNVKEESQVIAESMKIENVVRDGETIKNSGAALRRIAYEEAGIYEDLIKYIKDNGLLYTDFGLNKTVVEADTSEITKIVNKVNGNTSNAETTDNNRKTALKAYAKAIKSANSTVFDMLSGMTSISDAKSKAQTVRKKYK